jgi:hypothetical protein
MNQKQANRAMRRKAERENRKPKFLRGTKQEKMQKLLQNGITPEMLEQEFRDGYTQGTKDGIEHTIKLVYAAIMMAGEKEYGFGRVRAMRLLQRVDEYVTTELSTFDAIEAVWKRFGLRLEFDNAFNRIEEDEQDEP